MDSLWYLFFRGCEAQEQEEEEEETKEDEKAQDQEEDYDYVTLLAVRDVRAPAMYVAFSLFCLLSSARMTGIVLDLGLLLWLALRSRCLSSWRVCCGCVFLPLTHSTGYVSELTDVRKDWLSLVAAGDAGSSSTFSARTYLTYPLRWSPRGKDDLDDGAATWAGCPGRTLWQHVWERIDRPTQYDALWWLRLDGKTQVTIEYVRAVGTVDPRGAVGAVGRAQFPHFADCARSDQLVWAVEAGWRTEVRP